MNHEIELKYGLRSKKDFDLLFNYLSAEKCGPINLLAQENYFFDTKKKLLKRKGMTFRIRQQNSDYFLTVKKSVKGEDNPNHLSSRLEFECSIKKSCAKDLLRGKVSPMEFLTNLEHDCAVNMATHDKLLQAISAIDAKDLHLLGSFKNVRHEIPVKLLDRTFILELDHAAFPDNTEIFELEAEFLSNDDANKVRPLLEKIMTELKIKTKRSPSKSSRLYKILTQ